MAIIDRLKAIGDAIRTKTGKSAKLTLAQMPDEILSIQTGSSDVPFKYGGLNAVKLAEYSNTFTLAETSFVKNSSASTTATSILASKTDYTTSGTKTFASLTGSPTYAYGDKDIVVVQWVEVIPTHNGGDNKAQMIKHSSMMITHISKRKTTDTSAKTTRVARNMSTNMIKYYNTSSAITRADASYGFYGTPATPNVASTTSASTYVRVPTPTLYYRVSTSYEKADNIKKVTDVLWKWKLQVYVVDKDSTLACPINEEIDDILVNGL